MKDESTCFNWHVIGLSFEVYNSFLSQLVELYSLATPIFMPSPKFFHEKGGLGPDRTSTSKPFCQEDPDWRKK